MRRCKVIALVCSVIAVSPPVAGAGPAPMPVVGWLNPQPLATSGALLDGFRKGLGEEGYFSGKNVTILVRTADGRRERLAALADNLVRRGVAVIMAGSPPAALAAKRATASIPIVFTSGADPIKIGLVSSFNRPNGNVTGIHIQYSQVVGKRLTLLHEAVPGASRIALLVNPANPSDAEVTVNKAIEAARALGPDIQVFNATTIGEIDAAFAAIVRLRAGAVLIGPDPFLASRHKQILALATSHMLPTSAFNRRYVKAGALMSYGPENQDNYRLAGRYVGRILKGEKPENLPVKQPTKFELILNLKSANALGITIPRTVLLRADEVIE